MRISLVKPSSRMWTNLRPILCTLRGCVMTKHILIILPIFHSCCKSLFHSYAKLMQLHLFLMTNLERELLDFWLEMTCTPAYNWEVRPFLQKWSGNNFFFCLIYDCIVYTIFGIINQELIGNIIFGWSLHQPKFKSFFLKKKHRLLRCSLLSKLDIWKRIVEPVHTCSLWLIDTLLLD